MIRAKKQLLILAIIGISLALGQQFTSKIFLTEGEI